MVINLLGANGIMWNVITIMMMKPNRSKIIASIIVESLWIKKTSTNVSPRFKLCKITLIWANAVLKGLRTKSTKRSKKLAKISRNRLPKNSM
jgi:hypothetical protein